PARSPPSPSTTLFRSVDVWTEGEGRTIVALGDSITDGVGATTDGNDRWPDLLAERLAARGDGVAWAVSNQGVSGNRLLAGGMGRSEEHTSELQSRENL